MKSDRIDYLRTVEDLTIAVRRLATDEKPITVKNIVAVSRFTRRDVLEHLMEIENIMNAYDIE